MTRNEAIHVVRNPWNHPEDIVREARLFVCDALEAAERDRDALAAHLDKFYALVGNSHNDDEVFSLVVRKLINESPETSLARRDLLKQADALEEEADLLHDAPQHSPQGRIDARAVAKVLRERAKLRRQAEEGKS